MNRRKIVYLILGIAILLAVATTRVIGPDEHSIHGPECEHAHSPVHEEGPDAETEFWTCPMHPSVRNDGPGQCPICGMNLVAVSPQDEDKIVVDEEVAAYLGITSEPAAVRELVKIIRLPGRIRHDLELYTLQQEFLSVRSYRDGGGDMGREQPLREAAAMRLKLLGFDDAAVDALGHRTTPDESLIYPGQGRAWIHADVYEQDIAWVQPGLTVRARVRGFESEEFTGTVRAVAAVINPQSRAATARIEITDPQNKLRHEAYTDVFLELRLGRRLSVPRESLIATGIRRLVYVDLGQGRYQMRSVQTGVEADGMVEVISGLHAGEAVVRNGNFLLDSQSTLSSGQALLYDAGTEVPQTSSAAGGHRH